VSDRYIALNQAHWDERAAPHATSPEYDVANLVSGERRLSDVVAFDEQALGDIAGLRALHLQCHIGTDTMSLARLGAKVTGLDLSAASLEQARRIAADAGYEIDYVQSDVYSAPQALGGRRFELLYTGVGALCWLPDIRRWAQVVAELLEPGGRLFLREGHPMMWTIDEKRAEADGTLALRYAYFEDPDGMVFDEQGSYVTTDFAFENTRFVCWNHGLGEQVSALLDAGFELTSLVEHRSLPWNALPGRMEIGADNEWRMIDDSQLLPLSYTLQARRLG
jgi:SAM-dependent methyltransferase